jgi:predicted phosphodiesterase
MTAGSVNVIAHLALGATMAFGGPGGDKRGPAQRVGGQPATNGPCAALPARPLDVILGRPTRDSVTACVLADRDAEGCIAYGPQPGALSRQTPWRAFKKDEPAEIVLGALSPDTRYFYQLRACGTNGPAGSFHTQRTRGAAFTFTLIADSHLDARTNPEVLRGTLANAKADAPDFHLDLGDTFMTEKHASRESALQQYLAQRGYLGALCSSAPLFLALGNHDGENPRGRGDDSDALAAWSCLTRKRLFPNPAPDGFFTGSATAHPEAGLLQNYYAWEWGDALFVVLDPFWHTRETRGQRDNWTRTLGADQYLWLTRTLEGSRAAFKFVFIHHLVGGADEQARGGAEAAPLYEWGGKNADGTEGFATHRPGWPLPIHPLLVRSHASVVFHGHDHLYARQELDGLVYQACPQPGDPRGSTRSAAAYSYTSGVIIASSGHLRVDVSPQRSTVSYIRSDGSTAHSYSLLPQR